MKTNWKWITNIKITAFDFDGNIKDVQEFKNLITTVGLNMSRDFLYGASKLGTADATQANKLHDADGGFTATDVGKLLYNSTDGTCTIISGFVDAGELDLTDDIMVDTEAYTIYPAGDGIVYMAYGSGTTAPAVGQTTLVTETARLALTTKVKGGTGVVTSTVYLGPAVAVAPPNIEELGWFSGSTAGAGAGTGIMISRVLYSRTKTSIESLQIERVDKFIQTT